MNQTEFNGFIEVNSIFANAALKEIEISRSTKDLVWVHDYHLSLLPKMIHEAEDLNCMEQTIQMVYFLHIYVFFYDYKQRINKKNITCLYQ